MNEEKDDKKTEDLINEDENSGGVWFWVILIGLVILLAAYFLSNGAFSGITGNAISKGDVIKVGVIIPLSSDAASYGLSVQKGIDLAKDELKLNNFEIIYEDSKCDGKESVNAINKLISVDKVQVVIGELCSGATLAVAPIAEQNEVILISPASTSPEITKAGDFIFRTVPSDLLQGKFAAKLVKDRGYNKLAILFSNEDYGLGFSEVLNDNFEGVIVANEAFERGTSDLRSQLTKIKNSGADSIFIISNSPDSAVSALRQIKQLGIKAQIFGSEGLRSEDIIKGAGSSAEGLILTSVNTGNFNFFKKYRSVYGESPGPFSPQGYDALQSISLAINNGAKNSKQIKDELYKMNFNGASGKIDFDRNGDVEGNYEVYFVKAGIFAPIVVYNSNKLSDSNMSDDLSELSMNITELNVSM
jgi:branched-chain amino acid transport system substrate-binding protein